MLQVELIIFYLILLIRTAGITKGAWSFSIHRLIVTVMYSAFFSNWTKSSSLNLFSFELELTKSTLRHLWIETSKNYSALLFFQDERVKKRPGMRNVKSSRSPKTWWGLKRTNFSNCWKLTHLISAETKKTKIKRKHNKWARGIKNTWNERHDFSRFLSNFEFFA